ncbi:RHS repeat domain-containing protein [Methyloversatilis sp.]|uniref:RHS repeat domain-containing protein n=1 Tax=Methyloversatilis sp. TaxID=2569862 RepID=UPI003F6E5068
MKRIPKASGSIGRLLLCALLAGVASQVCADQYGYDELGNVQTLTSPRGTRTYTYDEIQRLDTEAGFSGQRDHAYDLNGNRTTDSASTPGTPTTATYTANTNRVATINGAAVSIDAAGQITNDGLNTYTWDDAGRLKTVSRGGQLRATYHYDHKHRRTRKVTTAAAPQGSKTLFFHYDDQDRLIAETTETGAPVRSYLWADAHLLAQIEYRWVGGSYDLSRELIFELDQLGTPRQARLNTGPAVWRWESDGYGTSPANEDPDGNGQPTTVNLRFPGQYYDEESGLHYNWHRYYVPRLGRYLSSDPIGIAGGINGYSYVGGQPTMLTDPQGLAPTKAVIWLVRICKKGIEKIRPVSYEEAVQLAKQGEDLQASRDIAKKIANATSEGRGAIKDPMHPDRVTGSSEGRRPHYHANPRNGGHIFYSIAAAATFAGHVDCEDCAMAIIAEGLDFFNPLSLPKDLMDLTGVGAPD